MILRQVCVWHATISGSPLNLRTTADMANTNHANRSIDLFGLPIRRIEKIPVYFLFSLNSIYRNFFVATFVLFIYFSLSFQSFFFLFFFRPVFDCVAVCENTILIYRIGWRTHRTAVTHASQWLTRNWIESMVSCISIVRIVQANGSSIVDFRVIHQYHPFLVLACDGSCVLVKFKRRECERERESARVRECAQ